MKQNINCKHYFQGSTCMHPAAPKKLFGMAKCVLVYPPTDNRLHQGCAVSQDAVKRPVPPVGPPRANYEPPFPLPVPGRGQQAMKPIPPVPSVEKYEKPDHNAELQAEVNKWKKTAESWERHAIFIMAGLKPGTELEDASLVIKKLKADVAELIQVAKDFYESLGELGIHCECGLTDCRTTRLRAVLAKHGGKA